MFPIRMRRDELLAIVRPILDCPTAPTFEDAVRTEIARQLRGVEGLELELDQVGNLIAWCGGERPWYAFVAHMDHPGWQLRPVRRFLGGVPPSLHGKGTVREFGDFGMGDLPAFRAERHGLDSGPRGAPIGCAAVVATLRTLSESAFAG